MATFTITAAQRKYNFPKERYLSMVIYKIINNINNKIYIWQSRWVVWTRWRSHCNNSGSWINAIKQAIKKYWYENFNFSVICVCDNIDELNIAEVKYINTYNSISPNWYNLHSWGNHHTASTESKLKMSSSACKRWWVKKSQAQIIADMTSEERLQRKLDSYKKMSVTKTWVPSNKKWIKLSSQAIENIRLSKIWIENPKKWKQIIDNNGNIYLSIKHAVEEIWCNRTTLMKHLTWRLKTVYNKTYSYIWVPTP